MTGTTVVDASTGPALPRDPDRRDPAQPAQPAHRVRRGRPGRADPLHPRVRPAAADRRRGRTRDGAEPAAGLRAGDGRAALAGRADAPGLATIPAIVRRTEDAELLRDALLENIHRANLNPLEEAAAYQQLLEEFDVTQEELAARLGRSRPVISNTIRLLKLPRAGPAPGRGRRAVRRACAGAALAAGPGRPGAAGRPDRRGGSVGPRRRGGRHADRRPAARRGGGRRPSDGSSPASTTSRRHCRTPSTPGSGSSWAAARAGSWSNSPPRRT